MSRYYNKDELKEKLEIEQVYDLIEAWGGEPEYTDGGLISQTICHNPPGTGSRKLYYYSNTKLCHCFSGCIDPSFDIFELCIKVMKIQKGLKWELYDAMDYIASYFGFEGIERKEEESELKDWEIFRRHKIKEPEKKQIIQLKEYDPIILTRFAYPRIERWEQEGISNEVSKKNLIGYYPGGEQITIPHFDIDNRLIGIRGRTLVADEAEMYGKYRPLLIGKQLYNHPLSMNLYNLNNSKDNIAKTHAAIVVESEKSCLQLQSFYGYKNDISVAVCGSSLSSYQVDLLKKLGTNELIIAFDKDFSKIGDDIFKLTVKKLERIYEKYHNSINVSFLFDKTNILPIHSSPIDQGVEVFELLLKNRVIL